MNVLHVDGLDQLARALREIPPALAKKHLGGAVSAAARLVRDEAEHLAPVDTGRLQSAVLMKRSQANNVSVTYIVGVRHGKAARTAKMGGGLVNLDAYYWFMVEFGTVKMAARSFMRPAWETKKQDAFNTMREHIRVGLQAEVIAHRWGRRTALSTSGASLLGSTFGNFVGPRAP